MIPGTAMFSRFPGPGHRVVVYLPSNFSEKANWRAKAALGLSLMAPFLGGASKDSAPQDLVPGMTPNSEVSIRIGDAEGGGRQTCVHIDKNKPVCYKSTSGNGEGQDNPKMQHVPNIGPTPAGDYYAGNVWHYGAKDAATETVRKLGVKLGIFDKDKILGRRSGKGDRDTKQRWGDATFDMVPDRDAGNNTDRTGIMNHFGDHSAGCNAIMDMGENRRLVNTVEMAQKHGKKVPIHVSYGKKKKK